MERFIIVDPNKEFCEMARWVFRKHAEVEVIQGKFEDLVHFDCILTAGNSFGLMDAGIDRAVLKFFGMHIQERVQQLILEDHLGEQPVGTALMVPTDHPRHPYVAHSPTMRGPANISGTDNVYLALWATLTSIHRHNRAFDNEGLVAQIGKKKIGTLACPGLGTGTGGMDPQEAAYQLRLAYEHYLNVPMFLNGTLAQDRFEKVHYGGKWGFENPRGDFS